MLFAVVMTVALPTFLVMGATILLGRRRTVAAGDSDADSVSFTGGVVSALFTVVLAFYIVFAWQIGADIESSAQTEADALVDAHWQAASLDEPDRSRVRDLVAAYAARVAGTEWDELESGRADARAAGLLDDLRARFTALPAEGGAVESARENGLADVRQIDQSRRARIDLATGDNTFNTVLLGATVIGAALTIAFPLLSGLSARPANVAIMGVLALVLGATIFLSLQLANPLGGPLGVGPGAFVDALSELSRTA